MGPRRARQRCCPQKRAQSRTASQLVLPESGNLRGGLRRDSGFPFSRKSGAELSVSDRRRKDHLRRDRPAGSAADPGRPFPPGSIRAGRVSGLPTRLLRPGLPSPDRIPVGLLGGLYAVGWHEIGSVFERAGPRDYLSVVSGGILAEILVGPMFLGGSWGEGGRGKLYFSLGSLF